MYYLQTQPNCLSDHSNRQNAVCPLQHHTFCSRSPTTLCSRGCGVHALTAHFQNSKTSLLSSSCVAEPFFSTPENPIPVAPSPDMAEQQKQEAKAKVVEAEFDWGTVLALIRARQQLRDTFFPNGLESQGQLSKNVGRHFSPLSNGLESRDTSRT
jgi:hypothetical protein